MQARKRNDGFEGRLLPAGGIRSSGRTQPLLALQRLAGNQAVVELLGVQRHALNLDELTDENIEQDLPVQRVALATPAEVPQAEYARLTQVGADVTQRTQAAIGELVATTGGANKAARHVGKGFQRGLLMQPSPIVEVDPNHNLLPAAREFERQAQGADFRWFWWNKPGGEDYVIKHRNWAGGFESTRLTKVGLGIRDLAAADAASLRKTLVHEAIHQMQWKYNAPAVPAAQAMEAKYRSEFEAYWLSGEMAHIRNADARATAIRTHIVGVNAQDTHTVYVDVRDWYHDPTNAAGRATIDGIRIANVGGLAWWEMNVHIKKLLEQLGGNESTDAERLVEWKKLERSEKRQVLADPVLVAKLRRTVSTPASSFSRAVGGA